MDWARVREERVFWYESWETKRLRQVGLGRCVELV